MMGLLYSDGVAPSEIEDMTYRRLKYWAEWSKYWNKQRANAVKSVK